MNDEQEEEFQQIMKEISREHMRRIWENAQMGIALDEEDERMLAVMREHPEYEHLWAHLDALTDDEIVVDGVNPVLHITFHTVVENQIALDDPPAVKRTVGALVQRGLSRHEAIHRVSYALLGEILEIWQNQRPFDERRYNRNLRKLLRERSGRSR